MLEFQEKLKYYFKTDWFVKKATKKESNKVSAQENLNSSIHTALTQDEIIQDTVRSSIHREIDTLITINQPQLLQQFVENGYCFSKSQIEHILINKGWWFTDFPNLGSLFKKQTKEVQEILLIFLDYLKVGKNNKSLLVESNGGTLKAWESMLTIYTYCDYVFEDQPQLLQKIIEEIKLLDISYSDFYKNNLYLRSPFLVLSEYPATHLRLLGNLYLVASKSHIHQKLEETKTVYAPTMKELGKVVHHLIERELTDQVNIPPESTVIIKNIHQLIMQISQDSLDTAQQWQIDNLLTKRLPQVYREFLGISESYRTTLRDSQGRTPTDLFVASLGLIEGELKQLMDGLQESKFQNLKVTNRYLQNLS